ncbi:MAG: hypothetical protein IT537_00630 [Hyphomicrobiales bacterium]|nr:hypothetical protein [Hyphomicrobiales bacterium]
MLAPFMRETHRVLGLWRSCKKATCRRRGRCLGNVETCGARDAADRWRWLKQAVAALRNGRTRSAAVRISTSRLLGLRPLSISWAVGEPPFRFFIDEQGRWLRPENVRQPRLGRRFRRLTGPASRWVRDAPHALAALTASARDAGR